MPYYLAPFIPIQPVTGRPFAAFTAPVGFDSQPNRNWIILGNRALLWLEIPIVDIRLMKIADDALEILGVMSHTALANFLGDRTYPVGAVLRDTIVDFLKIPPTGKGWGPLSPTNRGQQEIWLGPGGLGRNLFWSQVGSPSPPQSKDIQDNFGRTGNLDGSTSSDGQFTWSLVQGSPASAWTTDGSQLNKTATAIDLGVGLVSLDMDTLNHYAQVRWVSKTAPSTAINAQIGVRIRFGTNAAGDEGYAFRLDQLDDSAVYSRSVVDWQTGTSLALDHTAFTLPLTMYLEFNGSSFAAKIDGTTILAGTNTNYNTYKRTILVVDDGIVAANLFSHDDWRAADLVLAPDKLIAGFVS